MFTMRWKYRFPPQLPCTELARLSLITSNNTLQCASSQNHAVAAAAAGATTVKPIPIQRRQPCGMCVRTILNGMTRPT